MDANPIHVAIAGRMMFKRVMGKASFCNIQDLQGSIQVYVARDAIGTESYADFKRSDIGDIFGLEGFAFRTRTGEISICLLYTSGDFLCKGSQTGAGIGY